MVAKPDIVSLKWVNSLINKQAERAELALVNFSKDFNNKSPLLQCMWAVHQITSTLATLGMTKGEMLTLEMERSLNYIYKEKLQGERRKLVMGGIMQALKVLPAYLAHTQNVRQDTGQGLDQYINDLRRWLGIKPRPQAFFFHMEIDPKAGITADGKMAADQEIIDRAGVMLALYLQMAKSALRRQHVGDSMKNVARIARKMQAMFASSEPERFWFAMIGLCEGIAGGLIVPDECVAQIFKTGAFMIKYARENGSSIDPSVDYQDNLQQMLYYIASCKARPIHIAAIREAFAIDDETLNKANQGLVHLDALVTALSGALEQLNKVVDHLNTIDPAAKEINPEQQECEPVLEAVEAARLRLEAAGQMAHARVLYDVDGKLQQLYNGSLARQDALRIQTVDEIIHGIIDVKLDIEHKLEHGLCSSFSSREFELRESVVAATFTQMSLVENYLQQVLRRKALANALVIKPADSSSLGQLTLALNRHLNKTDQDHDTLRAAVREADNGDPDVDLLFQLAKEYFSQLQDMPERHALKLSLQLLEEIAGALAFADMTRESEVIERCRRWLAAAFKAGCVHEDEGFRCFAEAFAQLEMHLQRSVIDPLDDTTHLLLLAEQRSEELETHIGKLSSGADVLAPSNLGQSIYVEDRELTPQLREVFIEESEELIAELDTLKQEWMSKPEANGTLRDIRRHFHTFKGNGRAVGANIIGELGWAAQDLLDRVLDGDLTANDKVQTVISDVIDILPELVMSYRGKGGLDVEQTRRLTNRLFDLARQNDERLAQELPVDSDAMSSDSEPVANLTPANH